MASGDPIAVPRPEQSMDGARLQFTDFAMDDFNTVSKHVEAGREVCRFMAEYWKQAATIEQVYAKSLVQLTQSAVAKFEAGFVFVDRVAEEYSSVLQAWESVKIGMQRIAEGHSKVAHAILRDVVAPLNSFYQEGHLKAVIGSGNDQIKELKLRRDKLAKDKDRYEKASKASETAEKAFRLATHPDKKTKFQEVWRASEREEMQLRAVYKESITQCNQYQSTFLSKDMPAVYQELQAIEEKRIDLVKAGMERYVSIEGGVFPILRDSCYHMIASIDGINKAKDLVDYIERCKTDGEKLTPSTFEDNRQADEDPATEARRRRRKTLKKEREEKDEDEEEGHDDEKAEGKSKRRRTMTKPEKSDDEDESRRSKDERRRKDKEKEKEKDREKDRDRERDREEDGSRERRKEERTREDKAERRRHRDDNNDGDSRKHRARTRTNDDDGGGSPKEREHRRPTSEEVRGETVPLEAAVPSLAAREDPPSEGEEEEQLEEANEVAEVESAPERRPGTSGASPSVRASAPKVSEPEPTSAPEPDPEHEPEPEPEPEPVKIVTKQRKAPRVNADGMFAGLDEPTEITTKPSATSRPVPAKPREELPVTAGDVEETPEYMAIFTAKEKERPAAGTTNNVTGVGERMAAPRLPPVTNPQPAVRPLVKQMAAAFESQPDDQLLAALLQPAPTRAAPTAAAQPADSLSPNLSEEEKMLQKLIALAEENDFYEIFGVDPASSIGDITKRRRELIQAMHPDRFAGDRRAEKEATLRLQRINEIYSNVLNNEKCRAMYDKVCSYRRSYARLFAQGGNVEKLQMAAKNLLILKKDLKKNNMPAELVQEMTQALSILEQITGESQQ